ncbi:MAG: RluA family pseudouridine synthase [Alphaproteobacteria bacterium]|nr:RluA family pseudouridine synthase [Alphaproteobacteria bacterium]
MTDCNIYNTPIVNKDFRGLRIDKFLAKCFPEISRSQIQKNIEQGNVTCDDITVGDNSYKIKEGESFVLVVPEAVDAEPKPQNIELPILYEDDDIVVVNKPSGMVVHPAPGAWDNTMVNALLFHCNNLSGIGGVKRPGIVHRIDKETSGVLVVAKNDNAHKFLCEQFAEHSIERTYYAVCYGVPNSMKGVIEGDIGRSPYDRKKMAIVSKGGKKAVTHYQVTEVFKNEACLIKCNLETGRTHQIRVHLSSLGHNLLGDKLYVKSKKMTAKTIAEEIRNFANNFPRQALHAQSLGFIHPKTKEKMFFETKIPEDMQELLNVLRKI